MASMIDRLSNNIDSIVYEKPMYIYLKTENPRPLQLTKDTAVKRVLIPSDVSFKG